MKFKRTGTLLFAALLLLSCEEEGTKKRQVALASKDGESCLLEQKCKITVRRWEGSGQCCGEEGNAYYRCLVSNDLYQSVGKEERIVIDLNKCEKINP